MTVLELKEILKDLPDETEILVSRWDDDWAEAWWQEVDSVIFKVESKTLEIS